MYFLEDEGAIHSIGEWWMEKTKFDTLLLYMLVLNAPMVCA
jgi:hypothetical protein